MQNESNGNLSLSQQLLRLPQSEELWIRDFVSQIDEFIPLLFRALFVFAESTAGKDKL